ncbi:hypothetical protein DPMN_051731 [Dreissena polymorpha]|uniref:Uncharacterized protein n=1 Tax=Dreissena polymorpha TaxID=45954 RepID=A0A9D4HQJ9_DREPO|nr:hypothetical protein DPMN_051731 [Dreissena polymorpha]
MKTVTSTVYTNKLLTDARTHTRTHIQTPDITRSHKLTISHVIQLTGTIFEVNSCIKETNVLSKFHETWAKNVTFTVFTYINKTNVFTNFNDDWPKIVTSRGKLPRNIHIEKNAPPTGGHVFSPISTIFELVRDIN